MKEFRTKPALMMLGTSSGAGKSLMTTALCRVLKRQGEIPLPFKGQNMSNNAWVDRQGGEMAYSQALQAWAAGIEPSCSMNPILLKPQGDSTSEVIHLGKSVGKAKAETYYEEWFKPGWAAIQKGLRDLHSLNSHGRLVLEGAGSPVEVNLQHRDLTNLRLAMFLRARCLLIADIEKGGVFAQIIGTLALLKPLERSLIKGIIINRFRGKQELFKNGREWLEAETGIPILGVMPYLKESFPPEDSLDLLDRNTRNSKAEIEIAVIKLPSISNFSDFDALEAEPTVQIKWIELNDSLGKPDAVILPGSKQTIKDLFLINKSGMNVQIKKFVNSGGHLFGICGGLQMLGRTLSDPNKIEGISKVSNSSIVYGLDFLAIHTVFEYNKCVRQREVISNWPSQATLIGYEIHHGDSEEINEDGKDLLPLTQMTNLGWTKRDGSPENVAGTYLHAIFDNGPWRRLWLNKLREKKGLNPLTTNQPHHTQKREHLLNLLADAFEEHVDIQPLLGT